MCLLWRMATETTPSQIAPGSDHSPAQVQVETPAPTALSPALVMAAALVYTLEADGQAHASDLSQLQFTLEGNQDLYDCAADYVDAIALDQFLQDAPVALRTVEKICILINVYDSFVSAGQAGPGRTETFERLLSAFGMTQQSFKPYSKTIELKNNRAPLGSYAPDQDPPNALGPHLALASAMLYMVAADGYIGVQERAKLAVFTSAFEGLQKASLRQVRTVRVDDFLKQASAAFNQSIKLHILTNVCDTMLCSGEVAPADSRLFIKMLSTWGLSGDTFKPYYLLLKIKNVKPFDISGFRSASSTAQADPSSRLLASGNRYASAVAGGAFATGAASTGSSVWVNRTGGDSTGTLRMGSRSSASGSSLVRRRARFNLTGVSLDDDAVSQETAEPGSGVWVRSDEPDSVAAPGTDPAAPVASHTTRLTLAQFTARAKNVRKDTQLVNQQLDELESKMGLAPWASTNTLTDAARASQTDPMAAEQGSEQSLETFTVTVQGTENTLQTSASDADEDADADEQAAPLVHAPEATNAPTSSNELASSGAVPALRQTGVAPQRLAFEGLFYLGMASAAFVAALTVSGWRPLGSVLPVQMAQQVHRLNPCNSPLPTAHQAGLPRAKPSCALAPQPTMELPGTLGALRSVYPPWHRPAWRFGEFGRASL